MPGRLSCHHLCTSVRHTTTTGESENAESSVLPARRAQFYLVPTFDHSGETLVTAWVVEALAAISRLFYWLERRLEMGLGYLARPLKD